MAERFGRGRVFAVLAAVAVLLLVITPISVYLIAGPDRYGTDSGRVVATGTAVVEDCTPNTVGPGYLCRAAITWAPDPATGVQRKATQEVLSRLPLNGQATVEERYCGDEGASAHTCQVVMKGYPVRPRALTWVPGALLLVVAALLYPLYKLSGRIANRLGR
ncbi:hypothetical protein [Longispora albida]|uniref:hypothetical protein n=1 Tax=Longispora albida TaxID=203523 RepID=UPI000377990A|nr:hypothetical protein [Longispora albida]